MCCMCLKMHVHIFGMCIKRNVMQCHAAMYFNIVLSCESIWISYAIGFSQYDFLSVTICGVEFSRQQPVSGIDIPWVHQHREHSGHQKGLDFRLCINTMVFFLDLYQNECLDILSIKTNVLIFGFVSKGMSQVVVYMSRFFLQCHAAMYFNIAVLFESSRISYTIVSV